MGKLSFKQKIRIETILPVAFAMGIMISSDTLVMLGNFFGRTGNKGFLFIFFCTLFYIVLILQYKQLFKFFSQYSTNFEIIQKTLGTIPSFIPFLVKCTAVIFLSTGLLVSSGFVFNEVFLYWFPNFGFAFILLGLLSGLQFLPKKAVLYCQLVFSGIPVLGLLILIIAGLIKINFFIPFQPADVASYNDITPLNVLFMPMLFFIGFDLGFITWNQPDNTHTGKNDSLFSAVIFTGILFVFWGFVSLNHISAAKLLSNSIPHMIVARSILGNSGRFIMGTIVISGSLAAIHALFTIISTNVALIKKASSLSAKIIHPKIIILLLAFIIAGMMAYGLAGEEELETFINASLILWLISYEIMSVSYYIILNRQSKKNYGSYFLKKLISVLCSLILGICIFVFITMDTNPVLILKFLGIVISVSIIPGIFLVLKKNTRKT